jgi:DNA-binding CsgD family transcriptional regulator
MDDAIILGQLAIPAVRAAADLAVRARAGRDAAAAEVAIAAARDVIDDYRAATARLKRPDDLAAKELGWRMALCEAELARAAGTDDPAAWEAIRASVTARPAPFFESYALWRAAEALASSGGSAGTAAAAEPLREAHAIATRIGAGVLVSPIEGLARRLRIDLVRADSTHLTDADEAVAASPTPEGPADPFGLTTREREVLALVAEGYTNRRIADTLFISESTAGVHVSHILGKLGVETRTEAAAIAVRLGLDLDIVR